MFILHILIIYYIRRVKHVMNTCYAAVNGRLEDIMNIHQELLQLH